MNCARNYEKVLNFVKVMPKILLVPFFPGHGVIRVDQNFTDQMPFLLPNQQHRSAEDTKATLHDDKNVLSV